MKFANKFHSRPALGALFFALASSAIVLTRLDGGIALLWVANAPLLMGLCSTDVRRWWRLLIWVAPAAIGASMLFGPVAWAAPFLAVASLVETLLAATLLRRLAVGCDYFGSDRSIALFAAVAGLAAPMPGGLIAASVAAASLHRWWTDIYLIKVLGHDCRRALRRVAAVIASRRQRCRLIAVRQARSAYAEKGHWPVRKVVAVVDEPIGRDRMGVRRRCRAPAYRYCRASLRRPPSYHGIASTPPAPR